MMHPIRSTINLKITLRNMLRRNQQRKKLHLKLQILQIKCQKLKKHLLSRESKMMPKRVQLRLMTKPKQQNNCDIIRN